MSKENKILYHGSNSGGIKTFEPKQHIVGKDKKIVFATDDRNYALAMTYGTGDELAVSYAVSSSSGKKEIYVDELQPGKLKLLDKPGYLYEVEARHFEPSSEGLESEYVSYSAVPVLVETKIVNILEEFRKSPEVHLIVYEKVPQSMTERNKISGKPTIEHTRSRFL